MGRFLLGLIVAGVLWYGYERFAVRGTDAVERVANGDAAAVAAALPVADDSPRPAGVGALAATAATDRVAAALASLGAPESDPDDSLFRDLTGWSVEDRARLLQELSARARTLPIADAVGLLGGGNSFLRSDEGRTLALRIADLAVAVPSQATAVAITRLLESCMSGSIDFGDAAMRRCVDELNAKHGSIVRQTLLDPASAAGSRRHEVRSGDTLDGIASHYRRVLGIEIESGTLAIVNRISDPRALRVGQVLRIPAEPIRVVARKASYLMAVYIGDVMVRLYWIAHGKPGHETPEAEFEIAEKIERPDWHHDGRVIPYGDPENPLGTHFVKFRHEGYSGFGVHGTFEPETIGTQASLGCIRLGADDIVDFFRLVPRKAKVIVRA
jgi:nucleoid-associated protein YgaU